VRKAKNVPSNGIILIFETTTGNVVKTVPIYDQELSSVEEKYPYQNKDFLFQINQ
jgi:hypothetical protein